MCQEPFCNFPTLQPKKPRLSFSNGFGILRPEKQIPIRVCQGRSDITRGGAVKEEEKENVWQENAKPIGNFSGNMLILRTFFDIKLASIYYSIKKKLGSFEGKVLEVGCGNQPYRFLLHKAEYHGIDHILAKEFASHNDEIKYYENETFPENSGEYDWCFHTEVLEHISDPEHFMKECHRVLKPSGGLLFTVPFSYRYHYIPHDYYRYTPSGLENLLEKGGFQVTEIRHQGSDITVACYKMISVFFRFLTEKNTILWKSCRMISTLLCLPYLFLIHLIGMLSLALDWGSSNDTLGYLVIARKKASLPASHQEASPSPCCKPR